MKKVMIAVFLMATGLQVRAEQSMIASQSVIEPTHSVSSGPSLIEASPAASRTTTTGEAVGTGSVPRVEFGSTRPATSATATSPVRTTSSASSASSWPGVTPAAAPISRPRIPAPPVAAPVRRTAPVAGAAPRVVTAPAPLRSPQTSTPRLPVAAPARLASPVTSQSVAPALSSDLIPQAASPSHAPASSASSEAVGLTAGSGQVRLTTTPPPPLVPEVIPPRAFDGNAPPVEAEAARVHEAVAEGTTGVSEDAASLADRPEDLGKFVSRRETLGRPSAIIPPSDPVADASHASPDGIRTGSSGSWYKLAAGALFLASLGLIGYRNNQRHRDRRDPAIARRTGGSGRTESERGRRGSRERGSILNDLEPKYAGATYFSDDSDLFSMESGGGLDWEEEPIAKDLSRNRSRGLGRDRMRSQDLDSAPPKKRRRSPLGERVGGTTFEFETRPSDPEPTQLEYHDYIERDLRRRENDQREVHGDDEEARPRRRRPSSREKAYDRIEQLAADGRTHSEIAREMAMPVGEIETVLGMRSRGARTFTQADDYSDLN